MQRKAEEEDDDEAAQSMVSQVEKTRSALDASKAALASQVEALAETSRIVTDLEAKMAKVQRNSMKRIEGSSPVGAAQPCASATQRAGYASP